MENNLEKPKIVEATGPEGKWAGTELDVKSSPILDPYSGKQLSLRSFVFSLNPALPKNAKITKQDLFSHHEKDIKRILKRDGWTANEDVPPRVEVLKDGKYAIFVLCEPRMTGWGMKEQTHERAKSLNEYLNVKPNG